MYNLDNLECKPIFPYPPIVAVLLDTYPNRSNKEEHMKPLQPPNLHHVQTLSHEISTLHLTKTSLPPTHPVLSEEFDPDVIIKPILSTYYPQFFRLFDEKEHVKIWIGFHSALLKVWEWRDVEMAVEGFWEGVEEYFVVREEDRTMLNHRGECVCCRVADPKRDSD